MSILGALYSAVSGLTASSNALGIISDNISNSNTVGYKETSANFSTLVTQSTGTTTLYSPGGVNSAPFYNIDQQGVMQATNSPTDLAMSGHGFFVVNVSPGGASSGGTFSFTRAGNFTVNSVGNLVNGAGLYLQGQKLTPAQALAIANGNTQQLTATSLNSLQTVNVTGIGGTASATQNVTISANLPASDTPASGARTMTVPVFDSQGNEHDMTLSFTRVGQSSSTMDFTEAGAIATGDTFVLQVDGGSPITTAPLPQAAPTLTDVANVINGQFSAAQITMTGVPQVGDKFTVTIGATPYTTAALAGGGPFTAASVAAAINAIVPANFVASANGNTISIADTTGSATSANIAHVAGSGTGTETFAAQPSSNTFSASVVAGALRLTDSAGQPISGTIAKGAVGQAETFTASTTANGVPVNRWQVSAGFPSSGTTTATILPGDNIVQFNSDGTLNLGQSTFAGSQALWINWDPAFSGGQTPQPLTFNIGSNGQTNGLSQLGTTFSVGTINQDGVKFGNFTGVTVDANGIVTANFNNGLHQAIYILPIATFANPDGLIPVTGDTYLQSANSGSVLLNQAGTGSAGTVAPSSLENSTVDIATEFSKLIITQNAYQANSKVITVSNQMLQSLLNIQTG